ncbi:SemiSWEET transporter [Ekhidna sp.]|uniref:SemiSWEET transporter n=1 Tax=Ekhidna sp. TaxID=2608089 RepID=UPI0032994DF3
MEYIGFIAAFLTTISFAPQAIKTIRTKSTESLSLGMYLTFTIGVGCWLAYGIYLGDAPIIFANSITLILTSTILVLKIKHG